MTYGPWTPCYSAGMEAWIISRINPATGGAQMLKRKGDLVRPLAFSTEFAAVKRAAKENAA